MTPWAIARLLCPWDSPDKNTGVGCHFSPGHLPDPGIEPESPALQGDSMTSEPPRKLPYLGEHSTKYDEFSQQFSFLFIQQVFIEG